MSRLGAYERALRLLQERLTRPLPGPEAQALLSPRPRYGWVPGELPDGCRQAAAVILLYERAGATSLLLTLRRGDLEEHAGQVSLPGGSLEPGESHLEAALREAWEEVASPPESVRVLGALTPLHIPASGFHLHPIVGALETAEGLSPAEEEVARLIHTPLDDLTDPRRLRVERWQIRGRTASVPFFDIDGHKVWGATAMILAELLVLLGAPPRPDRGAEEQAEEGDTLSAPNAPPAETNP